MYRYKHHTTILDTPVPSSTAVTRAVAWVAALVTLAIPDAANAQSQPGTQPQTPTHMQTPHRDPAVGEAAFRDGRRLLKAGRLAAACDRFADSMRADPAPGTLANLADCEERLGRVASAWTHWNEAAAQMAPADPRRAAAAGRAQRLEPRVPRLTLRPASGAPRALTITRDGGGTLDAGTLATPLALDPGTHRLRVTAPGHEAQSYEVKLAAGERRELAVTAGAPVSRTTPPPLAVPPIAGGPGTSSAATPGAPAGVTGLTGGVAPTPAPRRWRPLAGYALAGVSAAALGGGIYFGLRALDAREDARAACAGAGQVDTPTCWSSAARAMNRDLRDSRLADVGFATGAAAGVAAAYLLLVPGPAERSGRVQAVAVARPGGAEVQLAGAF
jgi:hypothetical protein